MSSLPKIKKDENGNYYLEGIQERQITQQQLDYNEIVQSAQFITGPAGDNARKLIAENPEASAGLVSSLYKNGSIAGSNLVNTFVEIDKATAAQRAADQFAEAQRVSTEAFQKTKRGKAWQSLKFAARSAGIVLNTPIENFFGILRNQIGVVAKEFQLTREGKLDWMGNPTNPGDTRESLGLLSNKEMLSVALNPAEGLKQTGTFQAAKELVTTGKVDLGEGFFPNEEFGAGFKARQEQMKYNKIPVMRNGEQVKDANGSPVYRPYSPVEPLSFLITSATPLNEGSARFVNALGELGLYFIGDPTAAYAKLARTLAQEKAAVTAAGAMASGKQLQKITMLETQVDDAQKAAEASLAKMNVFNGMTRGQKMEAYKKALAEQTKVEAEYLNAVGKEINYEPIAAFISGESGDHIINTIANMDDWQKIREISRRGGKKGFTVEQSISLANAKNREEVLSAIAPYIADGSVSQNLLETGTKTTRFLDRIVPGTVVRPVEGVAGWAARGVKKVPIAGSVFTGLGSAYSKTKLTLKKNYETIVPTTGALVHYADKDALVDTITNYGRSTGLDEATISNIVNKVAFGEYGNQGAFKATTELFDSIFKANAPAFQKAGISTDDLKQFTRIFDEERKAHATYWADLHATGTEIDFLFNGGKMMTLSGPHLESEFLNSMIYFPAAKELMAEIGKVGKLTKITGGRLAGTSKNISKLTRPVGSAADYLQNQIWKKIVLTRPAYVIRNISEEQIRVMATGHTSFFNHPAAAIGMWLGREGGPKWKSFLNTLDPYSQTVMGTEMKMASSAAELSTETAAHSAMFDDYQDFMSTMALSAQDEIDKVSTLRGYKNVQYGEPGFWDGIANEIRIISNSPIAKAVARTLPGYEANTVDYFLRGEGREAWKRMTSARNEDTAKWLNTDAGARQYLFDGITYKGRKASVRARIEEVAGQGGESAPAIRKLITDGKFETTGYSLKVPKAEDSAINSLQNAKAVREGKKKIKDANQTFAKDLEKVFAGKGNWDGIRFKVGDPSVIIERGGKSQISQMINKFFDHAVEFEKTTTMGPEWRQAYWDAARTLAYAADKNAINLMRKSASKGLKPLVNIKGERIGDRHAIWGILEKAKGDGPLTIDEIHKYSSKMANEKVEQLFYNASKKRLLWHQLRLVAPFGQAWGDTAAKWGKLALENPDSIYKISRGLNWVNSPESSALYELTDARDYYDPNQGFFFTDPNSGQRQFFIPFMSSGLNFMTSLTRKAFTGQGNISTSGPFGARSNPQSFNFALGTGMFIPGVGPGIALSITVLDALGGDPLKLLPQRVENNLRSVIFPFQEPDISTLGGVVSSVTTPNWSRIASALTNSQESFSSAFAPTMAYLASSGDYNIDLPEDQQKLIRDSNRFAQWFTLWRGIFGLVNPTQIIPTNLTLDKSGNTLLATALYNDFATIEIQSGNNRNAAYGKFIDLYGPEQLFSLIGKTTGAPTNLYTYQLIQRDPSVLDAYPETYGYFYPNGGYSTELYNWNLRNNKAERLSSEELMQQVTRIRYYAAYDRLLARSVNETGWTSARLKQAKANLVDSYNMRNIDMNYTGNKFDKVLLELKKAAYDERFADSDAVDGLRDYLYQRDKAIEASGMKTLKNKASLPQREWLAEEALSIIQRNPDFQKLYYTFFDKELEGK